MFIYKKRDIGELLREDRYQGRGIIIGKTENSKKAVIAYFIMGRSANSRNRVFREEGDNIVIYPFDESKVEDPSLIIYSPIKICNNNIIVTNGDQTETIYEGLKKGIKFKEALETRCFEPDGANHTPRISGLLNFDNHDFSYEMSIIKSLDERGSGCGRYIFSYESLAGLGHFIHTYLQDGNPLPTFVGEPKRVDIPDTIDEFKDEIWNNLDPENRISLHVRYIDIETLDYEAVTINGNE